MFDSSALPENEKITMTKSLADLAHKNGLSIEGERDGLAGKEEDIENKESIYTKPDTAAIFVNETDVDAFAVSIGNAHGRPMPDEKLDFDRLREINKKVDVPLVLHGASGTPANQIQEAIEGGVCKINIDTDLRISFMSQVQRMMLENPDLGEPRELLTEVRKAMYEVVKTKIKLFGSEGKVRNV
jgi:ketose-bisphosphate aldolase